MTWPCTCSRITTPPILFRLFPLCLIFCQLVGAFQLLKTPLGGRIFVPSPTIISPRRGGLRTYSSGYLRVSSPLSQPEESTEISPEDPSPLLDLVGKAIVKRFIYQLAPTKVVSAYSPLVIEERTVFTLELDDDDETTGRTKLKLSPRALEDGGGRSYIIRECSNLNLGSGAVPASRPPPSNERQDDDGSLAQLHLGKAVHTIHNVVGQEGLGNYGPGALRSPIKDSGIALALYCAANPKFVLGDVMEVGCNMGLAGILSIIGAGIAGKQAGESNVQEGKNKNDLDKNKNIENNSISGQRDQETVKPPPNPTGIGGMYLTDSESELQALYAAQKNLELSGIELEESMVSVLDWHSVNRVPEEMRSSFGLVLATDLIYSFPAIKPLCRTMAHALRPSQYVQVLGSQDIRGRFIHVSPDRDELKFLYQKLTNGYRMSYQKVMLQLERYDLSDEIIDLSDNMNTKDGKKEQNDKKEKEEKEKAEEKENESTKPGLDEIESGQDSASLVSDTDVTKDHADVNNQDEVHRDVRDNEGYVNYTSTVTVDLIGVVAWHNENYDGHNSDTFFPTENGVELAAESGPKLAPDLDE